MIAANSPCGVDGGPTVVFFGFYRLKYLWWANERYKNVGIQAIWFLVNITLFIVPISKLTASTGLFNIKRDQSARLLAHIIGSMVSNETILVFTT